LERNFSQFPIAIAVNPNWRIRVTNLPIEPEQKNEIPLGIAAERLFYEALNQERTVILPMLPPDNDKGLKPGETAPATGGLPANCSGLVIAAHCSSADAKELISMVLYWQQKRIHRAEAQAQAN
jgi:hypothetical protein